MGGPTTTRLRLELLVVNLVWPCAHPLTGEGGLKHLFDTRPPIAVVKNSDCSLNVVECHVLITKIWGSFVQYQSCRNVPSKPGEMQCDWKRDRAERVQKL